MRKDCQFLAIFVSAWAVQFGPGAIVAGPPKVSAQSIGYWIDRLDSEDVDEARRAADALVLFGPLSVPALVECLREGSYPSFRRAADALARIGQPAAHDLVDLFVDTREMWIHRELCRILGRIGPGAVRVLVVEGSEPKPHGRTHADTWAVLARLGDQADPFIPALVPLLRDRDAAVRKQAVNLLCEFGPTANGAVPELKRLLEKDDDQWVRAAARSALYFISGPEAASTVEDLIDVLRSGESKHLWRVHRPRFGGGMPMARRSLGPSEAAMYLGRRRPEEAKHAISSLTESRAHVDVSVRFHAAVALWKLGADAESPIPMLKDALANEEDQVRFWAAHALVEAVGPEATGVVPALIAALRRWQPVPRAWHPRRPVSEIPPETTRAEAAANALVRIGLPVVDELTKLVAEKTSDGGLSGRGPRELAQLQTSPRFRAMGTIIRFGIPAVPFLRKLLVHEDQEVKRLAAFGLRQIDPEGNGAFMPDTAWLRYAADRWLVWSIDDRFGDGRKQVISRRTRYYLQRFGDERARLVYQMRGTSWRDVAAVFPDGTVLLASHHHTDAIWAFPDGAWCRRALAMHGQPVRVVRGYSDGALVQPNRLNEKGPLYFAPFRNHDLDMADARRLTDEEGIPVNNVSPIHRHGHLFAWQRRIFDLETGTQRSFEFAGRRADVTAFDGEFIVINGRRVFSLSDGSETEGLDKRRSGAIMLVREGIGYSFSRVARSGKKPPIDARSPLVFDLRLDAIDLRSSSKSKHLLRIPDGRRTDLMMMGGFFRTIPVPHMILPEGFVLWDGTNWRIMEWLRPGQAD